MPFLDTTIIIDYLKDKQEAVDTIIGLSRAGYTLKTTLINFYEVYFGTITFGKKNESEEVQKFFETIVIVNPDIQSMKKSAQIKAELQRKGKMIEENDIFIA